MLQEMEYTLAELPMIVKEVWLHSNGSKVWTLQGEMGAGKTTFVAELARFLGAIEEVSSPTFSIINQYEIGDSDDHDIFSIYHADLFRLKDLDEVIDAGIEDMIFQPQSISIIEWPNIAAEILPSNTLSLEILKISENKRKIIIK